MDNVERMMISVVICGRVVGTFRSRLGFSRHKKGNIRF